MLLLSRSTWPSHPVSTQSFQIPVWSHFKQLTIEHVHIFWISSKCQTVTYIKNRYYRIHKLIYGCSSKISCKILYLSLHTNCQRQAIDSLHPVKQDNPKQFHRKWMHQDHHSTQPQCHRSQWFYCIWREMVMQSNQMHCLCWQLMTSIYHLLWHIVMHFWEIFSDGWIRVTIRCCAEFVWWFVWVWFLQSYIVQASEFMEFFTGISTNSHSTAKFWRGAEMTMKREKFTDQMKTQCIWRRWKSKKDAWSSKNFIPYYRVIMKAARLAV